MQLWSLCLTILEKGTSANSISYALKVPWRIVLKIAYYVLHIWFLVWHFRSRYDWKHFSVCQCFKSKFKRLKFHKTFFQIRFKRLKFNKTFFCFIGMLSKLSFLCSALASHFPWLFHDGRLLMVFLLSTRLSLYYQILKLRKILHWVYTVKPLN